jgi:XRE family transcriptional regulator, aerobic/anaerobic benzoate catabolism transcriptional regulator
MAAVAPASGLLERVGARVRAEREHRGWSRRELSAACGVSERFLAQLEGGEGNISLVRFAEVAAALGTSPAALLAEPAAGAEARPVALLGLRGAGKSTVGAALAKRLRVPFVELDQRIEAAAELTLGEIFELHGEAYYRRLEHEVLSELLAHPRPMVLATGGSIVNDHANYALLRDRCRTVWLRARPADHWNRVIKQGDQRPMKANPHAFAELEALLAARAELYGECDVAIDTSGVGVDTVVARVLAGA